MGQRHQTTVYLRTLGTMTWQERELTAAADPATQRAFDRIAGGGVPSSSELTQSLSGFEGWEDPIPLGPSAPLPFPSGSIGAVFLREWIDAESEATQTPVDLAGVVALGVLAAACHGRVMVEVRPGYQEPVNIYAACALESGNRKSAVFSDATRPLFDFESALRDERRAEVARRASDRKILERQLTDAEAAAAKAKGVEAMVARDEAGRLAEELVELPVIAMPRLVVDDITPEALCSRLAESGGVVSVLSAEGGLFETMAGRYQGGVPNLDAFLKGHAGDIIRVDRKGAESQIIGRPCVTLALTVQPEVLRSLVDKPGFRSRGLVARFLFSLPVSTVGARHVTPDPVPESIGDRYCKSISHLLRETEALSDPVVLKLSTDASKEWIDFSAATEPRLKAAMGDLAHMQDWGSKLPGGVARASPAYSTWLSTLTRDGTDPSRRRR